MRSKAETLPTNVPHERCADCMLFPDCPIRDITNGETEWAIRTGSRVLEKGVHLFRTGDPTESVYFLKSGALKAYLLSPAGEVQVVAFYFPGDLIGLESMGFEREALCVEALSVSRTCVLPRDELFEVCARSRSVMRHLLVQASGRLRFDASLFALLGRRSAEQRVASFLLELSRRLIDHGSPIREFELKMTRADIGSYLALAVETVSRVLTRLQDSGVIEVERNRRVFIVDTNEMAIVAGDAPERPMLWSAGDRRNVHGLPGDTPPSFMG